MPKNKSNEFVTVETKDGDMHIGVIIPVDNLTVRIDTGMKGRPVVLDRTDIAEVLPVNDANPNIFRTAPRRVRRARK